MPDAAQCQMWPVVGAVRTQLAELRTLSLPLQAPCGQSPQKGKVRLLPDTGHPNPYLVDKS